MEFYGEKKINVTLETKLNADEVIKKLSEYVAERPKWFDWPLDCTKPYVGKIENKSFYLQRNLFADYLSIKGTIEDIETGAVVNLEMQDKNNPWAGPRSGIEFWAGTMMSAAFGTTAFLFVIIGSLIVFFQIHSLKVIFSIAALILLIFCFAIWKINKVYMKKLMVKVDNNVKFLSDFLNSKVTDEKLMQAPHKLSICALLGEAFAAGILGVIFIQMIMFAISWSLSYYYRLPVAFVIGSGIYLIMFWFRQRAKVRE